MKVFDHKPILIEFSKINPNKPNTNIDDKLLDLPGIGAAARIAFYETYLEYANDPNLITNDIVILAKQKFELFTNIYAFKILEANNDKLINQLCQNTLNIVNNTLDLLPNEELIANCNITIDDDLLLTVLVNNINIKISTFRKWYKKNLTK